MTLVCRYYDNYLEGEFILYKHKALPYEVWFIHYGLCISSNKNKYLKRRKIFKATEIKSYEIIG